MVFAGVMPLAKSLGSKTWNDSLRLFNCLKTGFPKISTGIAYSTRLNLLADSKYVIHPVLLIEKSTKFDHLSNFRLRIV
jgi:hypothetical protein